MVVSRMEITSPHGDFCVGDHELDDNQCGT